MNVSKSLYLAGKIIYANDERLNYYSYKELGLRCPVCGEPVHLRKGESRKPYFAHFKGTDPKQVEECNLRSSAYGNSSQGTESNLIEDKGQRLEIFQKHFLEILAINNSDLFKKIEIIKQEINVKPENSLIPPSNLENITSKCINWFVKNTDDSKRKLINIHRDIYKNDLEVKSREQIVCEVFDYLQIKSSRTLLKYLVYISIHKASIKLVKKNPNVLLGYIILPIKPVKFELLEIIIRTPWLEAFSQINGLDHWGQYVTPIKDLENVKYNQNFPDNPKYFFNTSVYKPANGNAKKVELINGERVIKAKLEWSLKSDFTPEGNIPTFTLDLKSKKVLRLIVDWQYGVKTQWLNKQFIKDTCDALEQLINDVTSNPRNFLNTGKITPMFVLLSKIFPYIEVKKDIITYAVVIKEIDASIWHKCFNELQQDCPEYYLDDLQSLLPKLKH